MRILILLCLTAFIGQAQITSLQIGTVKNAAATITNLENASRVLKANLPESLTVSDLKLEYSEYYGKYFLIAKVSGNDICNGAIQLGPTGNVISAFAGPGVEITCPGTRRNNCLAV